MSTEKATDREDGLVAVAELCAAFEGDLDWYKSGDFDETSARQRFVDKFFAALGWDVTDEAKRGPYADVVLEYVVERDSGAGSFAEWDEEEENEYVEAALKAGKVVGAVGVRRPDYSFRINGERMFFVEAKRPSVNINSPRPGLTDLPRGACRRHTPQGLGRNRGRSRIPCGRDLPPEAAARRPPERASCRERFPRPPSPGARRLSTRRRRVLHRADLRAGSTCPRPTSGGPTSLGHASHRPTFRGPS